MAYFNSKQVRYIPQPIPPVPPYVPPTPPTPETPGEGSVPVVPRPTFRGVTDISFYICTDEIEKLNKRFTNGIVMSGIFKEDVDLINPVLTIESELDLTGHNYIKMLGRTYHITSCVLATGNLYNIAATVDVLSTYNEGIRSLDALVDKTNVDDYSIKDINDDSHIMQAGIIRELVEFDVIEGNSFTEYPNLILITIGGEETT